MCVSVFVCIYELHLLNLEAPIITLSLNTYAVCVRLVN